MKKKKRLEAGGQIYKWKETDQGTLCQRATLFPERACNLNLAAVYKHTHTHPHTFFVHKSIKHITVTIMRVLL